MIRNCALILIFGALFLPALVSHIPESGDIDKTANLDTQLSTAYVRLPFIQNVGQLESDHVKYYAKTFAGTVYVTDDNLVYQTSKSHDNQQTTLIINEKFVGNSLRPQGNERSESVVSYFKGTQDNWKTDIPTYDYVSLGQVWDNIGVDLKAHGNNVEKIFTVHPGGDPSEIKMSFDGVSHLGVSGDELAISTDIGDLFFSKPIGYQIIDGKRYDVAVRYNVFDSATYGFSVLSYDKRFDLVIDPLIASTFIGGSGSDVGNSIAIDSSGNVYITGSTPDDTTDLPTTAGAFNTTHNGGSGDVFVSKFNSALSTLSASTFIGGSSTDTGHSIAIDSSGNVYITGSTTDHTVDYPTTAGAFNSTHGGADDVFVSKFNSALSTLSASTLIGGSNNDIGYDLAIDSSGNVYVTGSTVDHANDFPTTGGAYNTTHNGSTDVFVSKFNSALSTLSASTLIGGAGSDVSYGIDLDSSNNVYIAGATQDVGTDYPVTGGAYDTTHNGSNDVFVSKLNSSLSTLSASTFIGASGSDDAKWLVVDSSGNAYIVGNTDDVAIDYPTTAGAFNSTHGGADDVFVSKFNSALSTLSASTLIGGSGDDVGHELDLDSSGNVFIVGQTVNAVNDYPTTSGALNTTHNGSTDVFVSKFNSALSTLSASTFIGASGNDIGYGLVVNSAGNVYITGDTADVAVDYPTTSGAYDTTHSTGTDAFVSILGCTLLALGNSCGSVDSGGSVSVPVSSGGTAEVNLPSGNTISVTLPAGVSGTITFTDTDSGASASSIAFFGDIVDIDPTGGASCAAGCTVSFTFTGSEAASAGISPSQAKIFHDANENGSFESGEGLTTTVSGSDPYTATATASFTSKFAVGGIRANAVAAAQSLSSGGFFDFLSSCDPDGFKKGQSLKVYEVSYDRCESNRLQVLAYSTCGPITAQVTTGSGIYTLGISSTQPFLNDDKKRLVLGAEISPELESFSLMLKDKRDSFTDRIYLNQCSDVKSYLYRTGYLSEQQSPFFYDSYDGVEQIMPQIEPADVLPTARSAQPKLEQDAEPEPAKIGKHSGWMEGQMIDPEPAPYKQSGVVDPEPVDKKSGNGFVDSLIRMFSKIFYR